MSTQSRNWVKLCALTALAFVLGLFFAGLGHFPQIGQAQERAAHTPIVRVDAPRIPAARSLVDLSDAYAAVAEATRPSVVYIKSDRPMEADANGQQGMLLQIPGLQIPRGQIRGMKPNNQPTIEHSSGSGFIVSSDGYILTNNHVIEGSNKITVRLLDGREYDAKIVGTDKDTDVGVLKIDAKGLTPAALGSSDATRVGEWVLAIGNPLGEDLTFTVTQGIVSAKGRANLTFDGSDRTRNIQDYIQTDAVINRGNSGGPLVNSRGEVIGINAAIASSTGSYTGYAFAVPIDLARKVMDQIIASGHVQRAGMGIQVKDATREDADYLGLGCICGVRVSGFGGAPNGQSPAERAGLQAGDVITAIDGQPVKYVAQLQQNVGFRNPGEVIKVDVIRRDGKHTYSVKLSTIEGAKDTTDAGAADATAPDNSASSKNILGLVTEPLTAQTAADAGLPSTQRGLLIQSIIDGSPVSSEESICPADAQACAPDVIISVEGKPVKTEEDLKAALGSAVHGVVTLELINGSREHKIVSTRVERVRLR